MKSLFYVIFLFVGLLGCQKEPFASSQTKLSFNFQCNEIVITKQLSSTQERAVRDINIYLFNKSTGNVTKEYITNTTNLSLTLVKGEYDVYVIANCGYNLGSKTKTEIENLKFSISNELDLEDGSVLIMTAQETVYVNGDTYLSVILKRLVARVDVNISTEFDFTLNSVSVMNAPNGCYGMINNVSTNGFNYEPLHSSSFSFYMFENLAGENLSIKNERQKNKDTAPLSATYLHIIGSSEGKKVEYSIYLGENNSTDFNVSRNKNYSYSINLKGINEFDSRVNIASMQLSPFNESYYLGDIASSTLKLSCTDNRANKYWIAYEREEGDGTLSMDDTIVSWGVFYPFMDYGVNEKSTALKYIQNSVSKVKIRATVKDTNGFTFSDILSTNFIKNVRPPVVISVETVTESKGGSYAILVLNATAGSGVYDAEIKYEILSGDGKLMLFDQEMKSNQYMNCPLGRIPLKFFPSIPTNAKAKFTIRLKDGQEVSHESHFTVKKILVDGFAEGYRAGGKITYYVDGVENGTLPLNSCEYLELKCTYFYRHMTYPYQVQHESEQAFEYETTRPNYKLTSQFEYFGSNEEDGSFTCYCHGYTYMFRTMQVEFSVKNPNQFFNFRFYYD